MAKLRLAEAAKSDLRGIRSYSKASFGEGIARDYMKGLNQLFASLRSNPLIGSPEADLGEGVRRFAYRSHRVYYRVTAQLVTIARILHHAQDASQAFGAT